jgi:osmoprotectant transport system permease protein
VTVARRVSVLALVAGLVAGIVVVFFALDLEQATWSGRQLAGNWDVIWYYVVQHLRFTLIAVLAGTAVSLPLAYLAIRRPALYPPILSVTNVVYAVPSIALFVLLSPVFGFTSDTPVVLAMTLYTLIILVRNLVESVRSVPETVVIAADGMGFRRLPRFAGVELPLALPGIVAGLRLATVSTVSLISVGALIGRGGLGRLFTDGRKRGIVVELWSGVIAIVVLALVLDALLVLAGWLATPWERVGRSRRAARADRRAQVAGPVAGERASS